jgi:hypothetical protein
VARAVGPARDRDGSGVDPLDGAGVQHLVATGTSQSALRLRTYVNAVHPLDPLFDGYVLTLDIGSGALPDTRDADTTVPLRIPSVQTRVRDDLGVPVLVVNSETEVERMSAVRQPDTATYRLWEIAGVPHIDGSPAAVAASTRDLTALGIDPAAYPRPSGPHVNPLSHAPVERAGFDHALAWVVDGEPPPEQPRVELDAGSTSTSIRRDGDGNAAGGVRLPELEAPLAAYRGVRDGESDILARIAGSSEPLEEATLRTRYPSVGAYWSAYDEAAGRAVEAGVLLARDLPALRAETGARVEELITW